MYTQVGNTNEVISCLAFDKFSHRAFSLTECCALLEFNVTSVPQSLPSTIHLFEGMPVILRTHSISTDLGVTNGSQGYVRKIFTSVCPAGLTYSPCVLVEFPHSKVEIPGLPKAYFPLTQVTWTFTTLLDSKDGSKKKIRVT